MKPIRKIVSLYRRFMQGTLHHYSWVLPANIGGVSGALLKEMFRRIKFDTHQIEILRGLPDDALVVYVNKHKSRIERLFSLMRYRKERLPYSRIGLYYRSWYLQSPAAILRILIGHFEHLARKFSFPDPFKSGFVESQSVQGEHLFVSLVDSDEFYRRRVQSKTDPLAYLIGMQRRINRPIYMVPQLFFYKTQPTAQEESPYNPLIGYESKPGRLQRLWRMSVAPSKIFVEISEPVDLRAFIQDRNNTGTDEDLALTLRHLLLGRISRHRHSITGPVLKSNEEIKQLILTRDRLQEFMRSYAERRKIPMYKVTREALKYVDEIAANPKSLFISIAVRIVNRILKSMFEEISLNEDGLQAVKTASRNGPLVLIPCHKSHVDYLVLSNTVIRHNMPCPHTFAGQNLAFWPIGTLMRWAGAFFVRRSFKGAVFYSKVFAEYIYLLLEQGYNIEVFIEGTRSRSGKLLLPKLGMLTILLNAARSGAVANLNFVPVSIGYDRVPEDSSYLHEIEGGKKEPENFWQVVRARRLLKKKFGRIYINFGQPIPLNTLTEDFGRGPITEYGSKEINTLSRELGDHVLTAISRHTVVTPQALVSAAVLNTSKDAISNEQVLFNAEIYLAHLNGQSVSLSESLIINPEAAIEHILSYYVQNKYLVRLSEKDDAENATGVQYKITENKRAAMDYYKNNCISHFVSASFTAMAIIANDSFQFPSDNLHRHFLFLTDFFNNEFRYEQDRTVEYRLRKTIKAFIDQAILVPHPTLPDTYDLTSLGYRKLRSFAGFLKPFLESYWVVLRYISRLEAPGDRKVDHLKEIRKTGLRMYRGRRIDCKEALSVVNYTNAFDFFTKNKIRSSEDAEKASEYGNTIQGYLKRLTA